jgi:hypothetical protein
MKHGGFKAGWRYFWDAFSDTRSTTFLIGFFVAWTVLDIFTGAIVSLVRWLV